MALGKQAKILDDAQIALVLSILARRKRHPLRDRVIVLLSHKAGLRAAEISKLDWDMVLEPSGSVGDAISVRSRIAKKAGGRVVPLHPELKSALTAWKTLTTGQGPIIKSERGGRMTPVSICNWFKCIYQAAGLEGCTSHSGRRTFLTKAARRVHRVGGSLRDVQKLAGHASITTTQLYIDSDPESLRALVHML